MNQGDQLSKYFLLGLATLAFGLLLLSTDGIDRTDVDTTDKLQTVENLGLPMESVLLSTEEKMDILTNLKSTAAAALSDTEKSHILNNL